VDFDASGEIDLQAKLDEVTTMLAEANQHCQEVESQLKTAVAKAKVFREANISEADKSAAMALKLDMEVHDRKVVEAWQVNVRKMISVVEDLHWERARAPIRSDAEDIQGWLLKYEGAVEPLIRLTRVLLREGC
jgi:vacuolar-type H+-ATPase subunit D/Vma8